MSPHFTVSSGSKLNLLLRCKISNNAHFYACAGNALKGNFNHFLQMSLMNSTSLGISAQYVNNQNRLYEYGA
jgi:hypothetical protein